MKSQAASHTLRPDGTPSKKSIVEGYSVFWGAIKNLKPREAIEHFLNYSDVETFTERINQSTERMSQIVIDGKERELEREYEIAKRTFVGVGQIHVVIGENEGRAVYEKVKSRLCSIVDELKDVSAKNKSAIRERKMLSCKISHAKNAVEVIRKLQLCISSSSDHELKLRLKDARRTVNQYQDAGRSLFHFAAKVLINLSLKKI